MKISTEAKIIITVSKGIIILKTPTDLQEVHQILLPLYNRNLMWKTSYSKIEIQLIRIYFKVGKSSRNKSLHIYHQIKQEHKSGPVKNQFRMYQKQV